MWHAWSTEQLNDIFSQLTRTELGVAQLKQQQGAFEGRLEAVDNLEQRLARSEQALGELGARTQGVGATERALGGLKRTTKRARKSGCAGQQSCCRTLSDTPETR